MPEKKLGRGLEELLGRLKEGKKTPPVSSPEPEANLPKPVVTPAHPSLPQAPPSQTKREKTIKPPETPSIPLKANTPLVQPDVKEVYIWTEISRIIPNRFQPRKEFDLVGLNELAESIRTAGVIQPVLVRESGDKYELITGERRWRACQQLGLTKIPAIVKEADDKTLLEWAIIENTQRRDLNPVERGRAYKELLSTFNLTHEAVAERVGLDRSTITNFIRLLELPAEVQEEVSRGTITMGHARALLGLTDKDLQVKVARRIKKEGMSVRRLEYVIRYLKRRKQPKSAAGGQPESRDQLYLKELEDRLRKRLGTKVSITAYESGGYITISFYSKEDFQRILDLLEK